MDTSDSLIKFDEMGVCDHCRDYEEKISPIWNMGEGRDHKLSTIVRKIKKDGEGRDFDCILGMSGGIDSSYLLYLVTKKLGLKPEECLVFEDSEIGVRSAVDAGMNVIWLGNDQNKNINLQKEVYKYLPGGHSDLNYRDILDLI